MRIYVTFFLHAAVYNDYADEDIPDSIGNLPDADIIRARSRSARGSAEHSATQSIACACCAASSSWTKRTAAAH